MTHALLMLLSGFLGIALACAVLLVGGYLIRRVRRRKFRRSYLGEGS